MGTLTLGWELRRRNFPAELLVSRPQQTQSISVTGTACALRCAHCGGHYLQHMTALSAVETAEDLTGTSCLVSGGCNLEGQVVVGEHLSKLAALKGRRRYNFHVGLVEAEAIKALAPLADVVSFDFVGDDTTIRETLKLNKTVADYVECYRNLRKYCAHVAPHICIGLHGGQLGGEREALRLLAANGVEQLIFLVLVPTKLTEYAQCRPPSVAQVVSILAEARQLLPTTPLWLGCMRPGGRYRQELDVAALEAGINGIVQPSKAALERAAELGLTMKISEECCVL